VATSQSPRMTASRNPAAPGRRALGVALDLLIESLVMTARMMAFHAPRTSAADREALLLAFGRRR
jgi:hypothetical protein